MLVVVFFLLRMIVIIVTSLELQRDTHAHNIMYINTNNDELYK